MAQGTPQSVCRWTCIQLSSLESFNPWSLGVLNCESGHSQGHCDLVRLSAWLAGEPVSTQDAKGPESYLVTAAKAKLSGAWSH